MLCTASPSVTATTITTQLSHYKCYNYLFNQFNFYQCNTTIDTTTTYAAVVILTTGAVTTFVVATVGCGAAAHGATVAAVVAGAVAVGAFSVAAVFFYNFAAVFADAVNTTDVTASVALVIAVAVVYCRSSHSYCCF